MTDHRQLRRVYLSQGNSVLAEFFVDDEKYTVPVRDFSPVGMRVLAVDGRIPAADQILQSIKIRFGNEIIGEYKHATVKWGDDESQEYGVEFAESEPSDGRSRKQDRYDLDPDLRPLISANDPVFIGEVLHFVVEDISLSGLKLSTSLSNRHLLKGTRIRKATLFLPCVGVVYVDLEVLWVKADDTKLKMGVQYKDAPKDLVRDLLQFILFSSYRRIQSLPELEQFIKISPFQIRAFKKALRVRIVENDAEKEQMLHLRWLSYYQAGKVQGDLLPKDMWDQVDDYSTSYGVYLGRIMVGTFRFTPSKDPSQPFPFEKLISASSVKKFDRKDRVEVSKMGILPVLQNSDVLLVMFEAVTREIIYSAINLYIFTTDALEQNYRRLGAFKVSKSVPHPTLPTENLKLYMIDRHLTLTGVRTSGLTWNLVMKRVYNFYHSRGLFKTPRARFRIFLRTRFEKIVIKLSKER